MTERHVRQSALTVRRSSVARLVLRQSGRPAADGLTCQSVGRPSYQLTVRLDLTGRTVPNDHNGLARRITTDGYDGREEPSAMRLTEGRFESVQYSPSSNSIGSNRSST